MHSFRRLALLLVLVLPALYAAQAESSSSSSNPAAPTPAAAQDQAQQQAAQSQPQLSVQARIRARREQRRVAAIHDVYDHRYEVSVGMGFQRTHAGVPQKVNEYAWDVGVTKYLNERLGLTVDGRGYYGTPFVGINFSGITKPAISQYAALFGPTYRFYLQPKYSISARVLGGAIDRRAYRAAAWTRHPSRIQRNHLPAREFFQHQQSARPRDSRQGILRDQADIG